MKIKLPVILIVVNLLCLLSLDSLQAQSKSIEDILAVRLHDIGAIKNGNTLTGYYLFYEIDQIDKKRRSYSLQILDENLEQVAKKKISQAADIELVEAAFNDTLIMFKFHDPLEKRYLFKSYDLLGQKAKGGSRKFDKSKYYPPIDMYGGNGEGHIGSLYAVPGQGFVQYASVKNKKWGYIIDFLGPTRERSWKYRSKKDEQTLLFANHISANEDYLLTNISEAKNGFGKGIHSNVLLLDVNTGKKVFQTSLGSERPTQIINGFIDEDNNTVTVFGLYFKEGIKSSIKAKSRGIFSATLDMKGKIIDQSFISWEEDFAEFLPVNKKGKLKGSEYIAFHDFIKSSDGKTLIVGEKYGKKADAGGIAANLIGGALFGASGGFATAQGRMTKFVVDDLVIMKLDTDKKLESVDIIEKTPTDLGLPGGAMSPQVLAYFARLYGGFDYSFTQQNDDQSIISFVYLDEVKKKKEANTFNLASVNYLDGEFNTDQLELSGKSSFVKVLPAVPGYIAVFEIEQIEKKEKGKRKKTYNTLNYRLEKINY